MARKFKAYKGFDREMTCRDFRYEIGKEYETEEAILCNRGFHACKSPVDCLSYYSLPWSVYHEVFLSGVSKKRGADTKVVAKRIHIGRRIESIGELIDAEIEYIRKERKRQDRKERRDSKVERVAKVAKVEKVSDDGRHQEHSFAEGDYSASASSKWHSCSVAKGASASSSAAGRCSHALACGFRCSSAAACDYSSSAAEGDLSRSATAGNHSNSSAYGFGAIAASCGDMSHAFAAGTNSEAAAIGAHSIAEVRGVGSVAIATGYDSIAKGSKGSWIVLAERSSGGSVICVKSFLIDGEEYKPDTWYRIVGGGVVEVEEAEGE